MACIGWEELYSHVVVVLFREASCVFNMALSPSENVAMDVIFSTPGPTCLVSRVEEDAVVVLGMATVQILRCQALGGKGEEDDSGEVETHDSHVLLIVLPDMSPLVVGLVSSTTILRIADKQYMAPGTRPGTFLGLSIGEGEDREGDAESLRAAFEEAIEAIATLVIEVPTTDQDTDRTVSVLRTMSKGVQSGSQTAGATVVASAEVIARKLRAGGRRLQRRIVPVEEGQGTKVSQSTRHKVQSAKVLTGAASTISRSLVSGAMSTAASLGKSLSAALKETPAAKRMAVSGGERGAAAGELVVSTLVATGTIIQSFLEAGQILLASTAASTAELVEHKVRLWESRCVKSYKDQVLSWRVSGGYSISVT